MKITALDFYVVTSVVLGIFGHPGTALFVLLMYLIRPSGDSDVK